MFLWPLKYLKIYKFTKMTTHDPQLPHVFFLKSIRPNGGHFGDDERFWEFFDLKDFGVSNEYQLILKEQLSDYLKVVFIILFLPKIDSVLRQ